MMMSSVMLETISVDVKDIAQMNCNIQHAFIVQISRNETKSSYWGYENDREEEAH